MFADTSQIGTVLVNLVSNARDAYERGTGEIAVSLNRVRVTAALARMVTGLNEGPYAKLTVSDAGRGMDEDTLSASSIPFYDQGSR